MTGPRVVQFQRRPHEQQFSIETVFAALRPYLVQRFTVDVAVSSYPSAGLVPRLRAIIEARHRRGDVNHVVGDVHSLDLLLPRARTVLTVHDTEFLLRHRGPKAWLYVTFWLRLPVRRAAVVTVPSEATANDLRRVVSISRDRLRVVPNPVAERFTPPPDRPQVRRPTALLLGAWPNKNLDRSIEALRGLGADVVLVGSPSARQRAALADLGAVIRGDLSEDEMVSVYHSADLLVFPSTSEGFGLPIIEAQACGVPVITSDRSPMREIAGGAAALVDPGDVGSITAAINHLLSDHEYRETLIRDGLDNAKRFRADEIAAQFASIYDEILLSLR